MIVNNSNPLFKFHALPFLLKNRIEDTLVTEIRCFDLDLDHLYVRVAEIDGHRFILDSFNVETVVMGFVKNQTGCWGIWDFNLRK